MNMQWTFFLGRLALCVALFLGVSEASQAASAMSVISEPGDYIGLGVTKTYTSNNATFRASGNSQNFRIIVRDAQDDWDISVAAPRGDLFTRRNYLDAERAGFRTGRAPGLDINSDSRGCNNVWGSFVIRQIEFAANGDITMLDATFIQRCELVTRPRLIIALSYNATPLSFDLNSSPGDYVGGGLKRSYFGDTTDFVLFGTVNALRVAISGQRDDWIGIIWAPTGQTLHVGKYLVRSSSDSTHAGLLFFGDGRGCGQYGELVIRNIRTDAAGQVIGLNADFAVSCTYPVAPLIGKIRIHL